MRIVRSLLGAAALIGVVASGVACGTSDEVVDDESDAVSRGAGLCAAVRGNGHYIVTHFASLARITEHYGLIDAMAGGSSGSITTFIYESIRKNPAMNTCAGKRCSASEKAARVSLALKSLEGYGRGVAGADDAVLVGDFLGVAKTLQKQVEDQGISKLATTDVVKASQKLQLLMAAPKLGRLINPEVFEMLNDTEHLPFNVNEILTSIRTLGAFAVDDNRLFFRPGVLNWKELAILFGRVADFYAGVGAADSSAQAAWLDECATKTLGLEWPNAATVPTATGSTCGDLFASMVSAYRAKALPSDAMPQRLSEKVGAAGPIRKLVLTSLLEGPAVAEYERSRATYRSAIHPKGSIPFEIDFKNVKVGYWGAAKDLAKVVDPSTAVDLKSKKAASLGDATWLEVLTSSPAEPGLSRFVKLPDGHYSAGGWSDLAPTIALSKMGCARTVYITRERDESPFPGKIAVELGMSEAEWHELFDLSVPTSSFSVSVAKADAVWCTNWNSFTDFQQREMAADSWNAPFEVRPSFGSPRMLAPYSNVTSSAGKAGCTPGISGGAKFPR
jgi:hypothetical protein